ncbi:MAG TPA: 50S ribosomal protein L29 [Solirubrobacteraceae bacterium]|nr:50S ribosomal protein L29 [Solirubrobacteraceae bacterium]
MTGKDLRDLSEKELLAHVATARKDIFGLRFQHATGELENTAGIRTAKRDLARAMTVARERGVKIPNRK